MGSITISPKVIVILLILCTIQPIVSNIPQASADPDGLENHHGALFQKIYGVELGMSPEDQAKMMFIHPTEIKVVNITVKNVGDQDDTVLLYITIDLKGRESFGWDAWLDRDHIELKPGETHEAVLSIKGPGKGNMNDFIETCVNAVSGSDPEKNDSLRIRTFLMACGCGFRVDIPDNIHVTGNGIPTEFDVVVTYYGPFKEDLRVIIRDQPPGWGAKLSEEDLPGTDAWEVRHLKLTVTPPASSVSGEVGSVTVRAFETTKPQVMDQAAAYTILDRSCEGLEMQVDGPEKQVTPGGSASFNIRVKNSSNLMGSLAIVLLIKSDVGDWKVSLNRTSISLAMYESTEVNLTVRAPLDAEGTRLIVRIEASDEGNIESAEITTTTVCSPSTPGPETPTQSPGDINDTPDGPPPQISAPPDHGGPADGPTGSADGTEQPPELPSALSEGSTAPAKSQPPTPGIQCHGALFPLLLFSIIVMLCLTRRARKNERIEEMVWQEREE